MEQYLVDFRTRLQTKWGGSLVKVGSLGEPHAKEYLNKMAKKGEIERASWGWYWIPSRSRSPKEFLRRDRNFKVLASQTAASYWNHDFVHRDALIVKVKDASFAKALEIFAMKRGWQIHAIYTEEKTNYVTMDGLNIERMEQAIIDCIKSYAFEDAFATISVNRHRISIDDLERRHYWDRLPRSKVRIRSIIAYGWARINGENARNIDDGFVKRSVDDALDKVIGIG